jgi:LacI family transcriptional regulator
VTVSIRDIALVAGVSVATVSRVFNNAPTVQPALRERVHSVASRLGYRPNRIARSLRTKRTHTVGVVIPTVSNPHFADAVCGIQDVCAERGYIVLVANSDRDRVKEESALETLRDHQVDGVILVSESAEAWLSPGLLALLGAGMPVVAMDRAIMHPHIHRVLVDTRGGARDAVAHLVARARRRIAFIGGPSAIWTAEEKLHGYMEGLLAAELPFKPELVLTGDYTSHAGEARASDMLALRPRPDAVLVANNLMTLGVYRVLQQRSVLIPEEIAIVGYDDVPWADVVRPALTVVAQPTLELGRRAGKTLLDCLSLPPPERPVLDVLATRLVVRESA